jgi:hypothetical protein
LVLKECHYSSHQLLYGQADSTRHKRLRVSHPTLIQGHFPVVVVTTTSNFTTEARRHGPQNVSQVSYTFLLCSCGCWPKV